MHPTILVRNFNYIFYHVIEQYLEIMSISGDIAAKSTVNHFEFGFDRNKRLVLCCHFL
jgi:hypothetical protein